MKKILFLLVLFIVALTACHKESNNDNSYFVSILPQKYLIEKLVGDLYPVKVLVKPGESPATYEPTTKQMIELSKTKALFTIGVAFEDNLIPKLQKQYAGLTIVATEKNVKKHQPAGFTQLFEGEQTSDSQQEDGEEHHHHEGLDPHIWLSPDLVKIQVINIADYFIATYPEQATVFQANQDAFIAELDEVSREIEQIFSGVTNREFLCFHPAWGYFAAQFNLKQIPIEIEGKEPTPREQQKIIEFAKERQIKVIFVQAQFDQRIAASIAEQIGGTVISIDPLAENYLDNLKNIANKLAGSMGK